MKDSTGKALRTALIATRASLGQRLARDSKKPMNSQWQWRLKQASRTLPLASSNATNRLLREVSPDIASTVITPKQWLKITCILRAKRAVKLALYTGTAQMVKATGISALRKLPERRNSLRVLMYHNICDDRPNVVGLGTELFQRQQEYLARNYRVISLNELAAYMDGRQPLPPRAVLLTFDDGYRGIFLNAYPVLKQLGHKATIFVATDFIGGGTMPHDRVLAYPDRILGWDELRGMLDVFEVGSHGCSHRVLTKLSPGEVGEEIRRSKAVLEDGLGRAVRAFTYPKGSIGDFNDETDAGVKEAGYRFCFTSIRGTNFADMNPLRLRRYNVEDFGMAYFRSLLDGSADIVGLKDTRAGCRVKVILNRILGLEN